jgi:hypothetical protein
MEYRPCLVTLHDGRKVDCVYVVADEPYLTYWGIAPEQDPGKRWISISDVADLVESPSRLPAEFADQIYDGGECGMGYYVFRIDFLDGTSQVYGTGDAVDFIPLPDGKTAADIESVHPHEGRDDPEIVAGLDYYWCIYSGVDCSAKP